MNQQPLDSSVQATPNSRSVKRRLLQFLGTYLVAVIILTAITTIPYINHPVARPDFSFFLGQFIATTLLLPAGMLVGLDHILNAMGMRAELIRSEGPLSWPWSGLGMLMCVSNYVLVFIIVLAGSLARKQQTFRILYIVFIGLLFINLVGCGLG